MPVGTWRGYQGGNAVDEFQRCEVQLVCLGTASVSVEVAAGFAVLLAAGTAKLEGRNWLDGRDFDQARMGRSRKIGF